MLQFDTRHGGCTQACLHGGTVACDSNFPPAQMFTELRMMRPAHLVPVGAAASTSAVLASAREASRWLCLLSRSRTDSCNPLSGARPVGVASRPAASVLLGCMLPFCAAAVSSDRIVLNGFAYTQCTPA